MIEKRLDGFVQEYNKRVLANARNYKHHILSLTRNGPDRGDLAFALWANCAIPAILYGTECAPLLKKTITELERIQARVGKFILQLPALATNTVSGLDAGLRPIQELVDARILKFHQRLLSLPKG